MITNKMTTSISKPVKEPMTKYVDMRGHVDRF